MEDLFVEDIIENSSFVILSDAGDAVGFYAKLEKGCDEECFKRILRNFSILTNLF
jgi:hypothetical protein